MDPSIGAFAAKAQLSRLLRAVEQGQRFTITVRGKPVADLIPHRADATDLELAQRLGAALASFDRQLRSPAQPGGHCPWGRSVRGSAGQ